MIALLTERGFNTNINGWKNPSVILNLSVEDIFLNPSGNSYSVFLWKESSISFSNTKIESTITSVASLHP